MPVANTVIGLDIGTTSTIGIAVRLPDDILAVASRPVALSSPRPGWAEEDPAEWWANSVAILREIVAGLPDGPGSLAGICVTGMLPAVVLLDADGHVLRPSIQQSDGRVGAEVDALKAELDEAGFLARAGNGVNQQLVAAKLRWIARHEPAVFSRIATVFGSYDYVNWRLTGRRAVEQNWALEAGFTDLTTDAIADDLVALAGIPRSAVPDRTVTHEMMGRVSAEAAAETGLPEGLPVFGGAADHIASALAAGIAAPGDILLKFGGAGDIVVAAAHATPDPRLYLDYHLVPGVYAPNGCMAASGSALNWLAGILVEGEGPERPHVALDKLAAAVPAGSDGVLCLPYFLGEKTPIHDPLARGTFTGLSLGHGRGHLWRSLLEAIAYGFRHHIDVLRDMGHEPKRIFASDGGTKSRIWMQIVADIVGMPVQLLENPYGSSVGAAWVAAIGSGLSDDWSGVSHLASHGALIQPNADNRAVYDHGYRRYRATYEALKPVFAMA
ncbi:FGGY-family carbohydrate kinase [Kaistia dalseonensis]|uniref:Xylulokinase n=1 Tax=Kaistia dalseonensis TaxID=410840 RepID=A0ABU0HDN2_9HYPH|nr:FGGY-family carbohydrate kinase [Kaistia dalseonensis]MCX5497209.1 FGGY-family carbohydrate kinase [Kaistia dalseonensis]MDQ0439840.1 xylulokinase [Kaistia dalseonensis]